jgi:hypothetical protein
MDQPLDITNLQRNFALRQRLALLEQRFKLRQRNGLAFYQPHRKQDLFHSAGEYRYRYVRSGNRFGKSDLGAAEDVSWALGERLFYPKSDPRRTLGIPPHAVKILIICEDWDKSEEIFTNKDGGELGKIWKFLPPEAYASSKKNNSGKIEKISLVNGSAIHIDTVQSFKQNAMSQESSVWDAIHIDEPCPRDMYVAAARGLMDRNGKTWFTCTPLSEPWINDLFISRRGVVDPDIPLAYGDKWMITGKTSDNPYNSKEALAAFEELLTADEVQCRLFGKPLALAGMVYKEFDEDKHLYKRAPHGWKADQGGIALNNPPAHYTVRYALDLHGRVPQTALFAATAPSGDVYFFNEIHEVMLLPEMAQRIVKLLKGRFVYEELCDQIAWNEDPRDGSCWADIFIEAGLNVDKASKDLERGIDAVKQGLKRGNWHFADNLERARFEFDHYLWDPKKNKPIDKDDHIMECLYRLALTGLDYIAPPNRNNRLVVGAESFDNPNFELDDKFTFDIN